MSFGSSPRAGSRRHALIALLAAGLLAAVAAPSAHATTAAFCPTSGTINLGPRNGCTGGVGALLYSVSFFQPSAATIHCAVGKATRDPDSAQVIPDVCSTGALGSGEVTVTNPAQPFGFPRGRNFETSVTGTGYYGSFTY